MHGIHVHFAIHIRRGDRHGRRNVGEVENTRLVLVVPVVPAADLLIGGASRASASVGDVWPTSVGFSAQLPVTTPGHYTATLTFTVIGR